MTNLSNPFCAFLFSVALTVHGEEATEVQTHMTRPAELLFSDDFDEDGFASKTWNQHYSDSEIRDGILIAGQAEGADHGAVLERLAPCKDVIIRFSFKFAGTTRFNVPIDDKKHKESHAGHICRLSISPKAVTLGDDKEGIMRNDIFAMRRDSDPAKKAESDKLLTGRSTTVPAKFEKGKWYTMTLEILGDEMLLSLDDKIIGYLKSPGIAHATKTDFGFTVNGKHLHLDEVASWTATAAPDWEKIRDETLAKLYQ